LCQPVDISGERVAVSASLGFAVHPRDGHSSASLLAAADVALYAAKVSGKAQAMPFVAEAASSYAA
jgi:diguanylate cyclase